MLLNHKGEKQKNNAVCYIKWWNRENPTRMSTDKQYYYGVITKILTKSSKKPSKKDAEQSSKQQKKSHKRIERKRVDLKLVFNISFCIKFRSNQS